MIEHGRILRRPRFERSSVSRVSQNYSDYRKTKINKDNFLNSSTNHFNETYLI